MKIRLIVILALLVLAPLTLVAVLGVRVARSEREMAVHRWREMLAVRLTGIDEDIQQFLQAYTRPFAERALTGAHTAALSDELVATGLVRQLFVIAEDGTLAFPRLSADSGPKQQEFFRRTTELWRSRDPLFHPPDAAAFDAPGGAPAPAHQVMPFQQTPYGSSGGPQLASGWYTWYWGDGLNFIFWWRDGLGHTMGVELERMRFIADIVGALPDTGWDQRLPERIALMDSQGRVLYQWGHYEPAAAERPFVTCALSPPLSGWSLSYYAPADFTPAAGGRSVWFNLTAGGAAAALALIGLAAYFYRESSREMREAAQRVTFVNQVSHELKTPLTNIRMYAELLEEELADNPRCARSLGVIVSESQRLSRLIGNILTFGRKQRRKLVLHPGEGRVEDTVRAVLERTRPALEARGIAVRFDSTDSAQVRFDSDAVEQILNNLISNVEKYAADGGYLGINLRREDETTVLTVEDRGPGIPQGEFERVFQPFYRLSNKVSDGVTGTGIGLSLSRELALLHGGCLHIVRGDGGAVFEVQLHTPAGSGESA